jgi:hypothetical protein
MRVIFKPVHTNRLSGRLREARMSNPAAVATSCHPASCRPVAACDHNSSYAARCARSRGEITGSNIQPTTAVPSIIARAGG